MNQVCRGIRGATTVTENTKDAILSSTRELLEELVEKNDIQLDQIATAIFTTTRDINAEFPAVSARQQMGWTDVALLCSHEMEVPNSLQSCIRVLLLITTVKSQKDIVNIYLKGAKVLRP